MNYSAYSFNSGATASSSPSPAADNLLLSTNLGQYVLMRSDSYLVQWRFTGYDSSQQKHSLHPPRGLINFQSNEFPIQECSKVIAVEHDCLQVIDVKKKEIKKLMIKNEGGATKDSGKSNANNKEWLYKISLTKTTG